MYGQLTTRPHPLEEPAVCADWLPESGTSLHKVELISIRRNQLVDSLSNLLAC